MWKGQLYNAMKGSVQWRNEGKYGLWHSRSSYSARAMHRKGRTVSPRRSYGGCEGVFRTVEGDGTVGHITRCFHAVIGSLP